MMVGFFMILLDSTIVAVANPSIMVKLGTSYDTVIWVTSAYLLAYAVPLLVAGRLGDRFGPKNLYLIGLAVFTAASLWCGLSSTIGMLITARVAQGIGAAVMSPQTLSLITRIFPVERRGVAMSLWGATAGVATLVGPLAGGVLVDSMGWAWIFFVNVPIGIIGLGLAFWLIPDLSTSKHRFDLIGVALSGIGMFLIVFSLQEGQSHDWAPWIWAVLVAGVGFMTAFVYWQSISKIEPLIPLDIFRVRDFSLCNAAAVVIAFAATGMILPLMFYAQAVCGLSPTRSALLTAPMAITSGVLAPLAGKLVDRSHPRPVVGFGFSALAIGLTWLSIVMKASTPIWELVLPFFALGVAMAFIWAPITATATRNLPQRFAGASSGVFNATRQVGAVLGSAGMASFMTSRITAALGPMADGGSAPPGGPGGNLEMPPFLRVPFADAMSQSMLLPAFVALFGIVAAVFLVGGAGPAGDDEPTPRADGPDAPARRVRVRPSAADGFASGPDGYRDGFDDDDDYVEYTLSPAPNAAPPRRKLTPAESWRGQLDDMTATTEIQPIGLVGNGFHDDEGRSRTQDYRPPDQRRPDPDEAFFDDIDTYGGSRFHDTRVDDYGRQPPDGPRRRPRS
ncbi:MFS transporter [Mycobacterium paraterrae]|uniref:MFS transporter n=2 Tax=Mycobacterium paraterrae TaxID=577492 RepID=A0ABY3VX52_9MYCO|nr:MFS transporter [Mycobacterium paraterrae]UMB72157.1 MFS transporter [Mycobacterium paraterrae]